MQTLFVLFGSKATESKNIPMPAATETDSHRQNPREPATCVAFLVLRI
jgi:hypothetical protein